MNNQTKGKQVKLSIPEQHQKRIAIATLKMSDMGASIMGGMTKAEARQFLSGIGINPLIFEPVVKTHNETCTDGFTFDGEASFT